MNSADSLQRCDAGTLGIVGRLPRYRVVRAARARAPCAHGPRAYPVRACGHTLARIRGVPGLLRVPAVTLNAGDVLLELVHRQRVRLMAGEAAVAGSDLAIDLRRRSVRLRGADGLPLRRRAGPRVRPTRRARGTVAASSRSSAEWRPTTRGSAPPDASAALNPTRGAEPTPFRLAEAQHLASRSRPCAVSTSASGRRTENTASACLKHLFEAAAGREDRHAARDDDVVVEPRTILRAQAVIEPDVAWTPSPGTALVSGSPSSGSASGSR